MSDVEISGFGLKESQREMFESFGKIPRLNSEVIVTEKIDGTNAQVHITYGEVHATPVHVQLTSLGNLHVYAGSRNKYITPDDDNFGFAKWVQDNVEELLSLGEGRHYGEWWGKGIQRGYGLEERRFSLFNVGRWNKDNIPECCHIVPTLYKGTEVNVGEIMAILKESGSWAADGYPNPEGIILYHKRANQLFKHTFENTEGKWRR